MLVLWTGTHTKSINEVLGSTISSMGVPYRIASDPSTYPMLLPGDVMIAMGGKPVDALRAAGWFPPKRTIASLREKPVSINGIPVFVSYDPSIALRDYARKPEINWDVQLAARLLKTGTIDPVVGDYKYVDSFHAILLKVEELYAKTGSPIDVACDLETKGLDEYNPDAWIISISFTVEEGKSEVMYFTNEEAPIQPIGRASSYWNQIWLQIHWLLTSDKVSMRGANFKYDSRWLAQKWNIFCCNQKFDTLLVGSLLDENMSNSLKLHAKLFTPMGGYEDEMDKYDFGFMELVPKPDLLKYAGGDTDVTLRVANHLKKELLKDSSLTNFYVNLLQPSAKVFEKMERGGIVVDVPYYKELEVELDAELKRLHEEMIDMIPAGLQLQYSDNLKITRPALLQDFLFSKKGLGLKPIIYTEKAKEPSTSIDHLMMFEDVPEAAQFIGLLREYNSASKTRSTFVKGFLKHLRSDDRFHPSYMLFRGGYGSDDDDSGTNTGRTSAKDPAVQTIPKHTIWTARLRRAFVPPPGYTILQLDYSQGELRIAAVVANEATMIAAYKKGIDLHAITAAQLNGYSLDEFMLLPDEMRDELRSGGKAGNFGLIYGMQHLGFKEFAYTSYGVKMTEEDAFRAREAFFDLYPGLTAWHENMKRIAKKYGMVRSPLGRIRHLPLIHSKDWGTVSKQERQAINSPVQSCLSDMMQLAMVHIDRQYGHCDIHPFLMTHDSLAMYVPEDDAVEWAKRCKQIMENLPLKEDFGWDSPLKFIADAEMSIPDLKTGVNSFATLKKLKNLVLA